MQQYILDELSSLSNNNHYMKRYVKFVSSREHAVGEVKKKISTGVYETHHIIPKCFNAELIKDDNNLVNLTYREHFIAHYILAKATNDRRAWHAIWLMANGINKKHFNSNFYAEARRHHSEALSKRVKGVKITNKEQLKNMGAATKRYYTENKIVWHHNGKENKRIKEGDSIPEGFVYGMKPSTEEAKRNISLSMSKKFKEGNFKHFNNGKTGIFIDIDKEEIPEGFVPGICKKK